MAQALDVNPYTLYDTAGRDASEMMELLFWLDEFNPSALHLFLPKKFPGKKCNEVADTPFTTMAMIAGQLMHLSVCGLTMGF